LSYPFSIKVIEIILANLDCAYDISSCALVCRLWLGITNNHRALQTSVTYTLDNWPPFIRRFKSICIEGSYVEESSDIDVEALQHANEVIFRNCIFFDLDKLKECVHACGDLTRLEITSPSGMDGFEMVANVENNPVINYSSQKIGTLLLVLDTREDSWNIVDMFQKAPIEIENIELRFVYNSSTIADEYFDFFDTISHEVHPLLFILQKYQDKIRQLDVENETCVNFLKDLSRLKLTKLSIYNDVVEQNWVSDLIRNQPTITELTLFDRSLGSINNVEKVYFGHLTSLTVLKLHCNHAGEVNVVGRNTHLLSKLSCLELTFSENVCEPPGGCDISFIAKLPRLESISITFKCGPSVLTLKPIENPMLQVKEFHLKSFQHVRIDEKSTWNIFHQMPNLEKITLLQRMDQLDSEKITVSILNITILF
jgi:hypothetical protein